MWREEICGVAGPLYSMVGNPAPIEGRYRGVNAKKDGRFRRVYPWVEVKWAEREGTEHGDSVKERVRRVRGGLGTCGWERFGAVPHSAGSGRHRR